MSVETASAAYDAAVKRMVEAAEAIENADDDADLSALETAFDEAEQAAERAKKNLDRITRADQARQSMPVVDTQPGSQTSNSSDSPGANVRYAQPAGSSKPEEVYRPDTRHSFLRDLWAATDPNRIDFSARERLEANQRVQLESRDVTTGDPGATAVVPPRYLADLWEAKRRQRRVAVNLLPTFDIGSVGMSFTVPKLNTGLSVASQAGENQNFSETDLDTNLLTNYLETIGGLQDVSVQAVERTDPSTTEIIFNDLSRAYDELVERQVLHGAGHGSNELPGLLGVTGNIDVTWTETTPAGTTGLKKVYDTISQMATNFADARVLVMHPRRAAWFASQTTSAFPIFQQGALYQASGTQDEGFVGTLAGLPVYQTRGILTTRGAGTNQDVIFVLDPEPIRFGEGTPRVEVFRDVLSQTGTVRFRMYNYVALIPDRHAPAIGNIEGTGLVTPSFA